MSATGTLFCLNVLVCLLFATFPNPISDLLPLVATAAKFVTSEEVASTEFFVASDPNPETSPAAVFEFNVLLSVKSVLPKVIVPLKNASPFDAIAKFLDLILPSVKLISVPSDEKFPEEYE